MGTDNELTLEFNEYLIQQTEEINELLQPYFLELKNRQDSYQNTYGIGTPGDFRLLRKLHTMKNVENGLHSFGSFQQLKKSLLDRIDNSESDEDVSIITEQLELLDGWLTSRENKDIKSK